jgi:16S rRNA (uracil1498-N3)-methyltransferase
MSRHFHVPDALVPGAVVALDAGRFLRVLRRRDGDVVTLCDGRGQLFSVTLRTPAGGPPLVGEVGEALPDPGRDAALALTVWLPLLKGGRSEDLVRPLTELGVATIAPYQSRHAVVRLEGRKAEERRARMQAIAGEAANQCGRRVIPRVAPVHEGVPRGGPGVFFWEGGGRDSVELKASTALAHPDRRRAPHPVRPGEAQVLIGPEGGFSAEEAESLAAAGWEAFSLGPRILRAETAVVVGTTLVAEALGLLSVQGAP